MNLSKIIKSTGWMSAFIMMVVVLGAIGLAQVSQAVPTPDADSAQQRGAVMVKEEDASMVQVKDAVTGRIVANLTGYVRYGDSDDSDDLPLDIHSLTFSDGDAPGERIVKLMGEHVGFTFKYNMDKMQPGKAYFPEKAHFAMHIRDQQDQELKIVCQVEDSFYFESIGESDYNCKKVYPRTCSTRDKEFSEFARVMKQFELALISDPDHV